MDRIDPARRSLNMSHIRSTDTGPERIIRSALFRRGYRFRINYKLIPEHPDIALPKYHAVIFINGCFWHGHEDCTNFHLPASRTEFWEKKIEGNIERDRKVYDELEARGWRVCIIWECRLRGKKEAASIDTEIDRIENWLRSSQKTRLEIRSGNTHKGNKLSNSIAAEPAPEYMKK